MAGQPAAAPFGGTLPANCSPPSWSAEWTSSSPCTSKYRRGLADGGLAPVAVMAVVCLVLLWRLLEVRAIPAIIVFCVGGLCWVASQSVERWFEWLPDGSKSPHYWNFVYFEESLEIFGSGLFAIAVVLVTQHLIPRYRGQHPR